MRYSKSCACKQSKAGNSFSTSHGQAGVQPCPGKQSSVICNSYLGGQTANNSPCSSFFSQLCVLSVMLHGLGWPLSQLCPLPAVCAPPACSLVGWAEEQKRPWLSASSAQQYQKYPCINKIPTSFPLQIQNIAPYQLLWRKLSLFQPKPVDLGRLV